MSEARSERSKSSNSDRVRPFYCGTQFADWTERNCARCKHGYDEQAEEFKCFLEKALGEALIGDGTITLEVARKIGWEKPPPFPYTWDCPERESVE